MPFSDPKYPVVNPDPTVDDCVKSLRTSDYLGGALATASTWGYGFVIGKPYRFASANACATLGFTFATMYVMQNAVYRFTGYSENAKEVKKYGVHSTPAAAVQTDVRFPTSTQRSTWKKPLDWASYN